MPTVRKPISDLVRSQLQAEVVNRCPLCGIFEKTGQEFTNHHINHDPSQSEYWNLIRICQSCHDDLSDHKT
jgi:5-methylcytosine-specific restriction endonuclease McrA